jgi:putative Holliday junction resolvase
LKNINLYPVLAIDYGLKNIGFAVSDSNGFLSAPLDQFKYTENRGKSELILEIQKLITEYKIKRIVLGLPQQFEEKESESNKIIKNFAKLLIDKISIPILFHDESFSTKNAQNMLLSIGQNQKRSRGKIDSTACALFLQEFLNEENKSFSHLD